MTERTDATEGLLKLREAKGLRVPAICRIVFALFGVYSVFATPLVPNKELTYIASVYGFFIATNICFLFLLRNGRRLKLVGYTGLVLDVLAITSYVVANIHIADQAGHSAAAVAKDLFIVVCISFIAINGLAMRPLYPILLTTTSIGLHIYLWILAAADPRTIWGPLGWATPTVNARLFVSEIIFLTIVGGAISLLAWSARRTVLQAVALESERSQTLQRQSQLVMEARLGALSNLVAGISHDMNTPLGTVKSNADSLNRGLGQIREGVHRALQTGKMEPKLERVMTALESSSDSSVIAARRLETTVKRLRTFTRLDEAEIQWSDIHADLDEVLGLIPAATVRQARVEKDYGDIPAVRCFPSRLNQVFMTLLTNAFESLDGDGVVRIGTHRVDDQLVITVSDTGRGMPEEQLARIFDVRFTHKQDRVTTGFGLPAAQSIVTQHGGTITAESVVEQGTTFTIRLPIEHEPNEELGYHSMQH